MGRKDVNWTNLAYDMDQWRVLTNLRIPQNAEMSLNI